MTAFWYFIVTLAVIAAIINFVIAAGKRDQPVVALVRGLAGVVALAAAVAVVVGKAFDIPHPYLTAQTVFIATGVFIFVVLLAPKYAERTTPNEPKVTLQQRAARPANATVRLRRDGTDEWVN
ncbi:MAG TPA: hypothetical protein VE258_04440 [Ktedonobacterales bacterium]|nr:hypothetical protein [Ktedonobacterales bacterium]